MKLIKMSSPGWEKDFDTEEELKAELFEHICGLCRRGDEFPDFPEPPVHADSGIIAMLNTGCGCEFDVVP